MTIPQARAKLDLSYLNAEIEVDSFDNFVAYGIERGISRELLTRLRDLWDTTKQVGSELIQVGKIIVIKIFDFLKANPKLGSSLAIGGVVYLLTNSIPGIGPLLAPITGTLAALLAYAKQADLEQTIQLARDFFQLLIDIFKAVELRWS